MAVGTDSADVERAAAGTSEAPTSADRKLLSLVEVLRQRGARPGRILVVGCGSGIEAGMLAQSFAADTVGIDLPVSGLPFDIANARPAILAHMSGEALAFPDACFDMVYSFHALEHMDAPQRALAEMARVLRPGGHYCVGTPNSKRLAGYFTSDASLATRIRWNLDDLRMRLSGRWSNAAGAHAGFTPTELTAMCRTAFGQAEEVSDAYYGTLYAGRAGLLRVLQATGTSVRVYPCTYVTGQRQ